MKVGCNVAGGRVRLQDSYVATRSLFSGQGDQLLADDFHAGARATRRFARCAFLLGGSVGRLRVTAFGRTDRTVVSTTCVLGGRQRLQSASVAILQLNAVYGSTRTDQVQALLLTANTKLMQCTSISVQNIYIY